MQAHSFCLNLAEFPLNLEICIEHLSHGRLKIKLRPHFHSWEDRRYQVCPSVRAYLCACVRVFAYFCDSGVFLGVHVWFC